MRTNATREILSFRKMAACLLLSILFSFNSYADYEVTSADNVLSTTVNVQGKTPAIAFSSMGWAEVSSPTNLVILQLKINGAEFSNLGYVLFARKADATEWTVVNKGEVYQKTANNHVIDFKFKKGYLYSVKIQGQAHSFYSREEEKSLNVQLTLIDQDGRLLLNSGEVPVRISESDPYAYQTKYAAIIGQIYFR